MQTSVSRAGAVLLSVLAASGLAACSSPLEGDWRNASRCQPQENPAPGDHPGDGPSLSPGEVLPDPAKCPEAFRGSDRAGGAPPMQQPRPDEPGTYPRPNIDHGCADGETLNGFPCKSVPGSGGSIYPGAPELDTDPPQIPDY